MAAGTWTLYKNAKKKLVAGDIDLDTNLFRMRIFKAQASASVSVATLSLLSQIGTTNVGGTPAAPMSSYPLTGASVVGISAGFTGTWKWSVPTITVTASATAGTSLQYAVIYNSLSALGGHLLAWCKLSTAAFTVTKGNTLQVTCPTNGIFTIY